MKNKIINPIFLLVTLIVGSAQLTKAAGVTQVNAIPLQGIELTPESVDVPMLSWSVEFDQQETLRGLFVVNDGSAFPFHHIQRIKLYYRNDSLGTPETELAVLIAPDDQVRRWEISSLNHQIQVGDIYSLKVDINPSILEDVDIQLTIPIDGFLFAHNSPFLMSEDLESINAPIPINIGVIAIDTDQVEEFIADNISRVDYHLIPGQIQRTVLNWQIIRAGPEALTHLVLINTGTATGNDISKLTLVTKDADPGGPGGWGNYLSNTILTDLVLGSDGKTWSTPQSWDRINLAPGEEKLFLIFADINPSAMNGRTVRLVVAPDGMSFSNNTDFVMPNEPILTSDQDFFIASDEFPVPPQNPVQEIWDYLSPTTYAWPGANPVNNLIPWDMVEFNSAIYVAGKERMNGSYLWKTTDFNSWTSIDLSLSGGESIHEVKLLHKHEDPNSDDEYLLAFCITALPNTPNKRVFMKKNEDDWIEMDTDILNSYGGSAFYEDVVSFGDYVYFSGDQSPKVFRINPTSLNPIWEALPNSLEGDPGTSSRLIVFNNELFVASFSGLIANIWKSTNGTSWENTIPQSDPEFLSNKNKLIYSNFNPSHISKRNFAVYQDKLYFSFFQLFEYNPTSDDKWSAAGDINFFGDFLIFTVHDQLYAKLDPVTDINTFEGGVFRLTDQTWIPILDENNINFVELSNVPVATLGSMSYVLLGDIWHANGGINNVQQVFPQPQDLVPGTANITILSWSASVNFSDSIQSLTVENKGNAEAGLDITRVALYRNDAFVSTLVPSSEGTLSWRLPTGSPITIHDWDNDIFSIRIDIHQDIRPNRTIQFSIPKDGMGWDINNAFELSEDLQESSLRTINFQAPSQNTTEPIDGVLVFPNPGRDDIYFAYDLAGDANITITIYNPNAILVSEIQDFKTAGMGRKTLWQAGQMAPGTYLAVIQIDSLVGEKKVYKQKVYIKK